MLGGGAAPEGNHLFIGLHHPPGADTTRFKRDANFQCWNACSTCHDGLLAVVTSASQGAVLSGAVPPETRHHSQVVVVSVEYSSRTLPRCWQLCRKCSEPLARQHIPPHVGQVYGVQIPQTLRVATTPKESTGKRKLPLRQI